MSRIQDSNQLLLCKEPWIWKDDQDQEMSVDDLCFNMTIDTFNTGKAIFMLSRSFFVKYKKGNKRSNANKQPVFLHIYPSDIRAITLELDDDVLSLRFSMDRHPILIVPKHKPLVPKPRLKDALESMMALALVTEFTIRLDRSSMTDVTQLQHVACMFSSTNANHRPTTDHSRYDLGSLYGGKGGMVVSATSARNEESLPPPYKESAPSKHTMSHPPFIFFV